MSALHSNPIEIPQNSPTFPIRGDCLNEKQLSAVELLTSGKGYGECAAILQVDRKTLYNWRQDELFQEALTDRRKELWGRANDRVRALLGPAIDVMEQQLKEKYDLSRVRAATVLLRLAGMHRTLRME